jgi:D-alanyl-D-alanine carboxypeptidase
MNQTAREIGMRDTNYVNPHGLDASYRLEAYSVLEDQVALTKALHENEECSRVIGKAEHVAELKTISGKDV